MKSSSAAIKYAKALFAQALASNQVLACRQGLDEIVRIAKLRPSLSRVLAHPFVSVTEKKSMIHTALGEYATPLLERFLVLLVEKKRFGFLFAIRQEFQDQVDRHQNVQPLRVKSAVPLNDAQQRLLQKKLKTWLHSKVRMEVQVEPSLIGGLIVQTRDQEADQSIRGQLRRMRQQLLKAS